MPHSTSSPNSQNRLPSKSLERSRGGRIKSRPVGSDSDTGSDGMRDFVAKLGMAEDIEVERQFREANKGKAKQKSFQPTRRTIDEDDEVEKPDQEALKARKWRPMNGRPPEHMTASVAAQQKKYNPLIKMLGIKIKIIRSDDEDDSSSTGQDNILSRSTSFGSRSRPGSDKKTASSIRERLSPDLQTLESQDVSRARDELSTTESDTPNLKKTNHASCVSSQPQELQVRQEASTTEDEDEPPKAPLAMEPTERKDTKRKTRSSLGTPPPQESEVVHELSTTASEDEPPKAPPPIESEGKIDTKTDTLPPQESGFVHELSTTETEDEPPKELPPTESQRKTNPQGNTSLPQDSEPAHQLSTTESEDEPPKKPQVKDSEAHRLPEANKNNRTKSDSRSSTNAPSVDPTTQADENPSEQSISSMRPDSDSIPSNVPDKRPPGDLLPTTSPNHHTHKVTYPRIQVEARPNLEISCEAQDAIGPLPLSKTVQLTASINKFLKPYQRDGVKFFFEHFQQKNGVILGDDMGLGKTIQVIAFLSAIMGLQGTPDEKNRRKNAINKLSSNRSYKPSELGPTCLVICPNSVIDNWAREIKTWGYFEYNTLGGNTAGAETIARFNAGAFDILICGFTYARDHIDEIYDLDFTVVVVDEVQHLKNARSAVTRAFHKFKTKIRFGLTGTAMQNELSELHSLFDWVRPGALGTLRMWDAFVSNPLLQARKSNASVYEMQLGAQRAQALVNNCWPDLQLRRTKSKILHELPRRTDQIALCPMTETQKLAHQNLMSDPDVVNMRNHAEACPCNRVNGKGQRYMLGSCCDQGWSKRIFPYLILFQKVSNHLALTYPNKQDKAEKYEQDTIYLEKMFPKGDFSLENFSSKYDPELCGKWKVLKPLLEQWKKAQFKVLLFSQSTKMMDILEYWLQQDFPEFVRLDGSVAIRERFKRVDEFQTDPSKFIFLASIKAAGVGLNLTAANKVVIFDPSWNPSHDAQAMDRVVRIGQKREVECIRLISSGTTEELIYHRQLYKQGLSEVANTGKAPSRHFTGVQGDSKNQGDIFGVKNIFKKQANERAILDPEEQLDDFSYAFDQFVANGKIAANKESEDKFELVPLERSPQTSQPDANSAEALLRHVGVDILPHGEVVKAALDPKHHRDVLLPRNKPPKKVRPTEVTQPPLRGGKRKAKASEKKKLQSEEHNSCDSSSSDSRRVKGVASKDFGSLKSKRKRFS
ncbi:hypothetical protein PGT21_011475 [Puccinia graminis f. sp. tritici]|uniref:Uncharacterized protein n=1 Tax=Puccinia graminis f. sp. tritici TaxID=56615 RepID=A0A5B0PTS7_PUCGR|nr:hypothetical protein PGT21_011475 [Puccinia graminis f. sp. tritici]